MSEKNDVIDVIRRMPETVGISQILEEIELLAAIGEAEEQSRKKFTVSHLEVVSKIDSWAGI